MWKSDTNAYCYGNGNGHGDGNGDTNSNCYPDGYSYSNCNTHSYHTAYADAPPTAHTKAATDSGASSVRLTV